MLEAVIVWFPTIGGALLAALIWFLVLSRWSARRSERRRHTRDPIKASGSLVYAGQEIPCTIVDFSASGARVAPERDIPAGASLSLKAFHYEAIPGKVVRKHGKSLGIAFQQSVL